MSSSIQSERVDGGVIVTLRLSTIDLIEWEREQLDMLEDALWLAEQAIKGDRLDGPLILARSHLSGRTS